MRYSIALLIATVVAALYGLLTGNMELIIFTAVVSVLKYKEESSRIFTR